MSNSNFSTQAFTASSFMSPNTTTPAFLHLPDNIKAWLITMIVVDSVIITMNLLEMRMLIRKWNKVKLDRIEHLLLSLCIADLFAGIFMVVQDTLTLKMFFFEETIQFSNWIIDGLFMFTTLVTVSHVTVISIERLVAVALPTKYILFTTFKCKLVSIVNVWFWPIPIAVICTAVKSGGLQASVLIICVGMIFFAYMFLAAALIRRDLQMKDMLPKEIHKHTRDRRTTIICLFIGFSFVSCLLPYCLGEISASMHFTWKSLLITLNHGINPLLYFTKRLMDRKRSRSGSTASTMMYTTRSGSIPSKGSPTTGHCQRGNSSPSSRPKSNGNNGSSPSLHHKHNNYQRSGSLATTILNSHNHNSSWNGSANGASANGAANGANKNIVPARSNSLGTNLLTSQYNQHSNGSNGNGNDSGSNGNGNMKQPSPILKHSPRPCRTDSSRMEITSSFNKPDTQRLLGDDLLANQRAHGNSMISSSSSKDSNLSNLSNLENREHKQLKVEFDMGDD